MSHAYTEDQRGEQPEAGCSPRSAGRRLRRWAKPSAQALFEHVYQRYPKRSAGV
ncbi:MAG: hypothetical protein V9G63_14990 [Candidatus Competibacter sp.]|nr:hypothetical protein [Candidatus Competibacteraceae bacterium]